MQIKLKFNKRKFEAWADINDIKGKNFEKIINELEKHGIKNKFIEHQKILNGIKGIFEQKKDGSKLVKVAKGIPPVDKYDKYYELYEALEPTINGCINLKEIKKDDKIAKLKPGNEERVGMTVTGETILPIRCQPKNRAVEGTNVIKEGDYLVAISDGLIEIDNDRKVNITTNRTISDDIHQTNTPQAEEKYQQKGLKTQYSLTVTGNIGDFIKIEVGDSIYIGGIIENGSMIEGNNIHANGGVEGSVRIKAKGEFRTKFIESAIIESGGKIVVERNILETEIIAEKDVEVKGTIKGAIIKTKGNVMANMIVGDGAGKSVIKCSQIKVNEGVYPVFKMILLGDGNPEIEGIKEITEAEEGKATYRYKSVREVERII
ncbi:MAG: FapA family protein [bacterium]